MNTPRDWPVRPPCEFALLIPDVTDRKAADWTLETAIRLLRPAARGRSKDSSAAPDPFESVKEAVQEGNFDRIIISTLPERVSKWLRRDLIRRVEGLGVPVTAIVPKRASPHAKRRPSWGSLAAAAWLGLTLMLEAPRSIPGARAP